MHQKNKPTVSIKLQTTDRIIDALSYAALITLFAISLAFYADLPEEIPYHYSFSGTPDAFGGKNSIWILPGVGTLIIIGISLLSKIPSTFNYPVKITAQNASKQYSMAIRFMGLLKLLIGWFFCVLNYQSIQVALGHSNKLDGVFVVLFLSAMAVLLSTYLIKAYKEK
ncbi:MAG: DUF1648 domain-containing protein [Salinivirgaceae bacterium]